MSSSNPKESDNYAVIVKKKAEKDFDKLPANDEEKVVYVYRIKHRRDVYNK